jgi:hypothetical protein
LASLCALLPLPLAPQSPSDGALRGRIVDAGGVPLSEVIVRVAKNGGAWEQTYSPARDGSFTALALPPDSYTVRAELFGHALPCARANLSIAAGEIADLTLTAETNDGHSCRQTVPTPFLGLRSTLEPSQPAEASRAWESLGSLDSDAHDATLAGAPSSDTSEDDPATPAAERGDSELGTAATGSSLNGLSPTQNGELLDGLSTTQNYRSGPRGTAAGGPRTSANFGEGAVRSFQVLPHTFSAQYGGAAGGLVAVTSRGLAERLHGNAFAFTRQSAFAATNPFSVVTHYNNGLVSSFLDKPDDSLLELGASAGMPLANLPIRPLQHASFFGSLESQLRSGQVVSSPATANFYALTAEQLALLANRGVSGAAANTALDYLDSLSGPQGRSSSRILGFARLDIVPTLRQQITLGYIGNRFNSPTGSSGGASDAVIARGRASVADSNVQIDAVTARWLDRLSPRSTNELRGQLAHDLEFELPRAPLPQEPGISVGGFAPQVSIAPNGFAYGTPSNIGRTAYPDEFRLQIADAFTHARGRHLFTLGADWSRINDRIAATTNPEGTFLYDSGTTDGRDGGLVDWITDFTFNVHAYPNGGCPSINAAVHLFCFRSYTQGFSASQTIFVTHEFAGFAEDALRLPHNLLLTLGARYEYTLLPPPQAPNPVLDQVIGTFGGWITGATSVIPEDRNNIGPRVSLAWAPQRGRWFVMHIGYGVFYGRVPGATVQEALADTALPSTTLRVRITPSMTTPCPQVQNQGFGYPCAYTTQPPLAVAQTSSAVVFARNFRLPAVQRATLSFERGGRRFDLHLGYAMAIATQLPQSVDLNISPSPGMASFILQGGDGYRGLYSGQTFAVPLYTQRRSTAYGPVTALVSNANATYHSVNAEGRIHLGAMQLRGRYTFSRAIDYGPQLSASPRTNGQFDPFADGYDKGRASLDMPSHFTGELLLRSTLHHGPKTLRRTLSEWRMASIATAGSGAPYSYQIFGGNYLSGGRDSINGSGGATYLPTIGRNTLRLPPRGNMNLRIDRDLPVHEHLRLDAFAEAFNLLNTENLSRVETRAFLLGTPAETGTPTPLVFQDAATIETEGLTTPAFGTPTSSTSGSSRERQIELGLRLQF